MDFSFPGVAFGIIPLTLNFILCGGGDLVCLIFMSGVGSFLFPPLLQFDSTISLEASVIAPEVSQLGIPDLILTRTLWLLLNVLLPRL